MILHGSFVILYTAKIKVLDLDKTLKPKSHML